MAGYLLFRNYPRQKVFFDSRHYYYCEQLGNEYLTISNGGPQWRELLDRYRIDAVLCGVDTPIAALLAARGGWRVVENDGKFVLFESKAAPEK